MLLRRTLALCFSLSFTLGLGSLAPVFATAGPPLVWTFQATADKPTCTFTVNGKAGLTNTVTMPSFSINALKNVSGGADPVTITLGISCGDDGVATNKTNDPVTACGTNPDTYCPSGQRGEGMRIGVEFTGTPDPSSSLFFKNLATGADAATGIAFLGKVTAIAPNAGSTQLVSGGTEFYPSGQRYTGGSTTSDPFLVQLQPSASGGKSQGSITFLVGYGRGDGDFTSVTPGATEAHLNVAITYP